MTRWTRRALVGVVVGLAAVAAAAPGVTTFHPVPAVAVIHSSGGLGATGLVMLQNDLPDPVTVGSITRSASCDAEVTLTGPRVRRSPSPEGTPLPRRSSVRARR